MDLQEGVSCCLLKSHCQLVPCPKITNPLDSDVFVVTDEDKWASMFYDSPMVDYTIVDDQNSLETIFNFW